MNFNYNINDVILLANDPIIFKSEDETKIFELNLPTFKDYYTNDKLIFLIGFLEKDIEEIDKWVSVDIKTHYEFIHIVSSLSSVNENFKKISNDIIDGLKCFIADIKFDKVLRIEENIIITQALFDKIMEVIFKSMKKEKIIIHEDDDEFTKRQKAMKLKAEKIKRNGKKNEKEGLELKDMIAAILYEFPQYKIADIMNMNLYTFYFLFGNVGRISNYEVTRMAYANGLTKKYKYFIEK